MNRLVPIIVTLVAVLAATALVVFGVRVYRGEQDINVTPDVAPLVPVVIDVAPASGSLVTLPFTISMQTRRPVRAGISAVHCQHKNKNEPDIIYSALLSFTSLKETLEPEIDVSNETLGNGAALESCALTVSLLDNSASVHEQELTYIF